MTPLVTQISLPEIKESLFNTRSSAKSLSRCPKHTLKPKLLIISGRRGGLPLRRSKQLFYSIAMVYQYLHLTIRESIYHRFLAVSIRYPTSNPALMPITSDHRRVRLSMKYGRTKPIRIPIIQQKASGLKARFSEWELFSVFFMIFLLGIHIPDRGLIG